MPIAPAGWKLIAAGFAAAAVMGLLARHWGWAAPGLLFVLFSLYFFRDPNRTIVADPATALSPADGKVLTIEKEEEGWTTLRIFLSIFNVHVQRAPFDGKLVAAELQKGPFKIAALEAARKNERNILTFEGEPNHVVEQITGAIARRIEAYVEPGDEVRQGQRIGIIYFGSQVALKLPEGWNFTVKPGQRVVGGETIVARRADPVGAEGADPVGGGPGER